MHPIRRYTGFADLIDDLSDEAGNRVAFERMGAGGIEAVTGAAFAHDVRRRAHELEAGRASCEALVMDGSYASVVESFACALAGLQSVLLPADVPRARMAVLAALGDADAVWPAEHCEGEVARALRPENARMARPGYGRMLFFTSGTTAQPKPVMLSDAHLMASAWNGSSLLALEEGDRVLNLLPLSHVFGYVCGVLWGLSCGARVVLGRGKRHLLDDARTFRPTVMPLVPSLLQTLLTHDLLNPELRMVLTGAAACPPALATAVRARGIELHCGYGLTETSSGVALSLGEDVTALTVCPDCRVTVAQGGALCIAAPHLLMDGYYRRPDDTAQVLADGVLRTGDTGSIDASGCLRVSGRSDNIAVLRSGVKVSLRACEEQVRAVLGEDDVAVIGGEGGLILVCGRLKHPADRHVLAQALSGLGFAEARDARIVDIAILDHSLPRTASGEVARWQIDKEVSRWQASRR